MAARYWGMTGYDSSQNSVNFISANGVEAQADSSMFSLLGLVHRDQQ